MKRDHFWRILIGMSMLCGLALLPAGAGARAALQAPADTGPYVSEPVTPVLSLPLRDLRLDPLPPAGATNPPRVNPDPSRPVFNLPGPADPLRGLVSFNPTRTPALKLSFEGIHGPFGITPPDTNGDVGPQHYVQIVNEQFAVYNKSGVRVVGPNSLNSIFTSLGGDCATNGRGDPIALYDPLADRWLLSQFTSANDVCVAISKTADATGSYWLYEFPMSFFPDYFKFGVWPDGYYMSSNEDSYTAYAFDRANMLAGSPATFQRFSGQTNLLLPSDVDGSAPPPAGTPNYFYTFKDNDTHGGADRLEVYAFHVDWVTSGNTTFTLAATIPIASFTYTVCGYFVFDCIPQGGTAQKVDSVSEWPMHRLAYRNFGDHAALVGNFSVDVGSDQAGIRWFELRKGGAATWTLYQEGTQAPDSLHRWMGSIAMDRAGNIALGYSASSSSEFPSIRYAARLASDPAGTLGSEVVMQTGGGSQTGSDRWGDYSAMGVDPADDCTFWYTQEYYPVSSPTEWHTRIGAFRIPGCLPADVVITKTASSASVWSGEALTYTLTITATPAITVAATVTDTFPAGLSVQNVSGLGWSCAWDDVQAVCDAADLSLASLIQIAATAPITPGLITNTAEVSGDWLDLDTSNNHSSVGVTVFASPIANDDAYQTLEDTPLHVPAPGVLANDAGNLPLTATLANSPAHGLLTLNLDGSFVYTPTLNFNGSDGFGYIASDGTLTASATVALTVTAVNDLSDVAITKTVSSASILAGEALSYTLTITATPAIAVAATVTDTFPAGLAVQNVSGLGWICSWDDVQAICNADDLSLASLIQIAATAPITPGLITNTAEVSGDWLDLDTSNNHSSVGVTVFAPPIANHDAYQTLEDTPLSVPTPGVLANDHDAAHLPLTASLALSPAHGTLVFNPDGSFIYTPTLNYNGSDGFGYIVSNGTLTASATVALTVTAVNDLPVVTLGGGIVIQQGETISQTGHFSDVDSTSWTATVDYGDGGGSKSLPLNADKTFHLSHRYLEAGVYTVTVTVKDNAGGQATRTFTVTVKAGKLFLPLIRR